MRTQLWLLTGFIAIVAIPAQARGHDEVMAGAYRCSAISDDKQWLDCSYGAAQPLRVQLALPPAPEAQIRLAQAPPGGGEIRNAMARDEALAGAARCYLAADDRQWLDCYYAAAQPVRALLNMSPPPNSAPAPAVDSPAFAVRKPSSMPSGLSDWFAGSQNQRIVSKLASYNFDQYGIFTVTLANGQVWRQQSGDTSYARWKKPAGAYTAVITRGALGSIDLRVQDEPHSFKVSRLQ